MDTKSLLKLIGEGETKSAIDMLIGFIETYYARFATEVWLISSRYNQVMKEWIGGRLPLNDYQIELNSINKSILDIVNSVDDSDTGNFHVKKSIEEIQEAVLQLNERYENCRKKAKTIQTTVTRLREKNEIGRKLGELFINYPDLVDIYAETDREGIIIGLAIKFKIVPDTKAIDIFEGVVDKMTGNFSRGCIVNALAEVVYSGQLRIGDDARIYAILDLLLTNADEPLEKNIIRVKTDLDYLLGRFGAR